MSSELHPRYIGLFKHRSGKNQMAKLDMIEFRSTSGDLRFKAILTLFFGDFNSHEYVSYHYDEINYDTEEQRLDFEQTSQDLVFSISIRNKDHLRAEVSSDQGHAMGYLDLTSDSTIEEVPAYIIRELSGSYLSRCQGQSKILNLQAYRSSAESDQIGNLFGDYNISGQLGVSSTQLCGDHHYCVTNQINGGSYDFFTGQLSLYGSQRSRQCQVHSDSSISCGSCHYEKLNYKLSNKIWPLNDPFDLPIRTETNWSKVKKGSYYGYLYHERKQSLQRFSIDIVDLISQSSTTFKLAAMAKLYFGSYQSHETLSYRFDKTELTKNDTNIVLNRTKGSIDTVIEIKDFGPNHLKGIWYSNLFGRIGTFYVTLNESALPKQNLPVEPEIAHFYKSKRHYLELDVYLNQTPVNTDNPYFPLSFTGYLGYTNAKISSRIAISGGSYDFYTGKIAIESENGQRVFTGSHTDQNLALRWMSNGFGTIIQDFEKQVFERVEQL